MDNGIVLQLCRRRGLQPQAQTSKDPFLPHCTAQRPPTRAPRRPPTHPPTLPAARPARPPGIPQQCSPVQQELPRFRLALLGALVCPGVWQLQRFIEQARLH